MITTSTVTGTSGNDWFYTTSENITSLIQGVDFFWRINISGMAGVQYDGGNGHDILVAQVSPGNYLAPVVIDYSPLGSGLHDLFLDSQLISIEETWLDIRGGAGADNLRVASNFNWTVQFVGGAGRDTISGGAAQDLIWGDDGNDVISGYGGADIIEGGFGSDFIDGGDGDDVISNTEFLPSDGFNPPVAGPCSIDTLHGGAGNDTIHDGDIVSGGDGNDSIFGGYSISGGAGDDYIEGWGRILGDGGNDQIVVLGKANVNAGSGDDIVWMNSLPWEQPLEQATVAGGDGADSITISGHMNGGNGDDALTGMMLNDTLIGGLGVDTLTGGAGDDIYLVDRFDIVIEETDGGYDVIRTGTSGYVLPNNIEGLVLTGWAVTGIGSDVANSITGNARDNSLSGGAGSDTVEGGLGADAFHFDDGDFGGMTSDTADRITDFSHVENDKINLKLVDANTGTAADDVFTFIGTAAFTGTAGQLRVEAMGADYAVMGDQNGDGAADFWIMVHATATLVASDFVL